jgi:hypothetical protein
MSNLLTDLLASGFAFLIFLSVFFLILCLIADFLERKIGE